MKTLQKILFVFLLPLFVACETEDSYMWSTIDYFPLEAGNYWEYKNTSPNIDYTERNTIGATVVLNNKIYWPIKSSSQNSPVSYRRKSADGKVFYKDKDGDEYLKFDLNRNEGEEWQYKQGQNQTLWTAKLVSKSKTVKINEHTFKNCYHFSYDIPEVADEEHQIILAPGAGIVRISSSSTGNLDLIASKVGKYTFE